MTIYIFMFISCFICCFIASRIKIKAVSFILEVTAILIPSIIAGNRSLSIGTDVLVYGQYMSYVAINTPETFFNIFGYGDILFSLLTILSNMIFKNIHMFLFTIQAINCSVIYLACKNMRDKCPIWLSYLLFLLIIYFRQLNLLRQGVALSFSIYAFSHLINNDNKKFYFWTLVASFFHISSIIVFILPGIRKITLSNKTAKKEKLLIFYFILISVFILFLPLLKLITSSGLLPKKYTYDYFYQFLNKGNRIDMLGTFYYLFLCLVNTLISFKKEIKDRILDYDFWFHLCFISFILYMLNIYILYIDRISFYFIYPIILFFVPQLKVYFKNDLLNKFIIYFFIILIFCMYWYVRFIYQNAGNVYPYVKF